MPAANASCAEVSSVRLPYPVPLSPVQIVVLSKGLIHSQPRVALRKLRGSIFEFETVSPTIVEKSANEILVQIWYLWPTDSGVVLGMFEYTLCYIARHYCTPMACSLGPCL